jgi:uncharacterized protein YndB with AHSA1/START domain
VKRGALETLVRGGPVVLEMAETMPGPPEAVWDLITDWEHQGDWMLEARDFVVTSERREGVGVTAHATVTIGGITTRDEIRVAGWQPTRRLIIEHRGWIEGRGELRLTALGTATTHLFWTEELRPPLGLLGSAGLIALKPLMLRVFKRDLEVLKGLVRARTRALEGPSVGSR